MQQVPVLIRPTIVASALALGAVVLPSDVEADPQSFRTTAPVTVAFPNDFGIDTGDTVTANVIFDPDLIIGSGREVQNVASPGQLNYTIESILFAGNIEDRQGGHNTAHVVFEDGVFNGFSGYNNRTIDFPEGISLSTSTGFQLDRDEPDPVVFAAGGPWSTPVPLVSEN